MTDYSQYIVTETEHMVDEDGIGFDRSRTRWATTRELLESRTGEDWREVESLVDRCHITACGEGQIRASVSKREAASYAPKIRDNKTRIIAYLAAQGEMSAARCAHDLPIDEAMARVDAFEAAMDEGTVD